LSRAGQIRYCDVVLAESVLPLGPAMVHFLESAVALQIATAGADLRPSSTRGFGCCVEEDRRTLRVCVLEAQAGRFLADLEVGCRVAVNATDVLDLRSVQAKGPLSERRAATLAEQEACRAYAAELVDVFVRIGVPRDGCGGLWHSGAIVVVRVAVDALFDQTPGPDAGRKLEAAWTRL
jgi:hypothetical protein